MDSPGTSVSACPASEEAGSFTSTVSDSRQLRDLVPLPPTFQYDGAFLLESTFHHRAMLDDFAAKQSDTCIRLYTKFRAAYDAAGDGGARFVPYDWRNLRGSLSVTWMPYVQMLDEYSNELANSINALAICIRRLRAWATIVASLTYDEKLEATTEFIDFLGTVALGLPYTIKSRFAYSAAHLCHQANRTKDLIGWKDEFPRNKQGRPLSLDDPEKGAAAYLNDIDPICAPWSQFRAFKSKVEAIAGASFKARSYNFRHAYNHRFSPHFVIGISDLVSRTTTDTGTVQYSLGGNSPLNIGEVADLLQAEHDLCYDGFIAFQALVREHEAAITNAKG